MFKSDSEIETMLSHPNNGTRVIGLGKGNSISSGGNGKGGTKRLSNEEKSEIGVLAEIIGTGGASELTGEHKSAVSHYRHGINGNGTVNEDLRKLNEKKVNSIKNEALNKAAMFLSMLDEEKALKMNGKSLASVSEKMVSIYEKLGPKTPINIEKATVIFHAPRQRKTEDYTIIDVEPISSN